MALPDDLLTQHLEVAASGSYDRLTELCVGLRSTCVCFYLMRDLEMNRKLAMMRNTLQLGVMRLLALFMGVLPLFLGAFSVAHSWMGEEWAEEVKSEIVSRLMEAVSLIQGFLSMLAAALLTGVFYSPLTAPFVFSDCMVICTHRTACCRCSFGGAFAVRTPTRIEGSAEAMALRLPFSVPLGNQTDGIWTFGTSLYFTIITFTSVGFGDVSPSTPGGMVWVIITCIF